MDSIARVSEEVKCTDEMCEEEVFRDGLCWEHFKEEVIAEWDAQDAERDACLEGRGYIFDKCPALGGEWWGDELEEVCADDHRLPR